MLIKNELTMKIKLIILLSFVVFTSNAQQIALLKYRGGGDWYANPTSLPNLVKFCNQNMGMSMPTPATVEVGSKDIFQYPFIHMTGHGYVVFSDDEIRNLRQYLIGGGFLHIDDNYGLDKYIRPQMKKVFPELDFKEVPFTHPIFHQKYEFSNGLPKIHEHDLKAPKAYALIWEGRIVCLYTYECDLGDGWEDFEVHRDSDEIHQKALKMGANIIRYVFTH